MKKRILSYLLLVGFVIAGCGNRISSIEQDERNDLLPSAPAGKDWKLVYSDEFNGTEHDESIWETPVGVRRDGYWAKEDSYLDGKGNLIIRTREEGGRYYSGAIRSIDKF